VTVTLADDGVMGTDVTVARRAWVSTQRDQREATPEAVEKLIRFLLSNRPTHASPFGHPHVTFLVECPIFVAREWMRHRTQTYSEVSSRYSDMSGEAYLPPLADFRTQVGRPGDYHMERMLTEDAETARHFMEGTYSVAATSYRHLLDLGVAREVARNVLPVGTMTRFYATASLRNWLGFLVLRNHPAALLEIRREAEAVEAMLADLFPVTMRVWTEEGRPTL
jgi:thymidylate synthase (FAD)